MLIGVVNTKGLTEKQKRFCEEFVVDGNATQATIRAGYSKKSAGRIGGENLKKLEIQKYIRELQAEHENQLVMNAQEMRQRLTAIARGQIDEDELVMKGIGPGCTEPTIVKRTASIRDQEKAMDQLARMGGFYNDTLNVNGYTTIVIGGEEDIDE